MKTIKIIRQQGDWAHYTKDKEGAVMVAGPFPTEEEAWAQLKDPKLFLGRLVLELKRKV